MSNRIIIGKIKNLMNKTKLFLKINSAFSNKKLIDCISLFFLIVYPLRHINVGLDFWDTGYSCANFMYFGFEHMDSMWLFATYLANVVGHCLTKLPFGNTLIGLNVYSNVFAIVMGVSSYLFASRKIGIPRPIVMLGEVIALNLAFYPRVILYDTLTYMLLLFTIMALYYGFYEKRVWCFFVAGWLLGLNVFVRFSNLPQVAVFVAGVLFAFRYTDNKLVCDKHKLKLIPREFITFVFGYITLIAAMFIIINSKYGIDAYVNGIMRLFEMTDNADGYSVFSMIFTLFGTYYEGLRRLFYIVVTIITASFIGNFICGKFVKNDDNFLRNCQIIKFFIFSILTVLMLGIMTLRGFYKINFYHYSTMYYPSTAFLTAATLLGMACFFDRKADDKLRLFGIFVILQIAVSSVGSNTGMVSAVNSMYFSAAFVLYYLFLLGKRLINCISEKSRTIYESAIFVISVVVFIYIFQSILFGTTYTYMEAKSARGASVKVEGIEALNGVIIQEDRAKVIQELGDYINDNNLKGHDTILYGYIPALSFYLDLPAAFNPWPDLDSYNIKYMSAAMNNLETLIDAGKRNYPLILADKTELEKMSNASKEKWNLIECFIDSNNYIVDFENERFIVYRHIEG